MRESNNKRMLSAFGKTIMGTQCFREDKKFYDNFPQNVRMKTRDNIEIGAFLYKPELEINDKTKFILFLHGKSCERHMMNEYLNIDYIMKQNIVLLVIDYRGFADNNDDFTKKGGNFDVLAGMQFLSEKFKPKEISIIAHSFGCALALEYCSFITKKSEHNKNNEEYFFPGKVILLSPFSSLKVAANDSFFGNIFISLFRDFTETLLSNFNYDNVENAKYAKSLYILHGDSDAIVKVKHAYEIKESNPHCNLKIYNKIGHMNILYNNEVWKYVFDILNSD